jgi:hypothetical protein
MNANCKRNWMKMVVLAAGLLLPGMVQACSYQLSYAYTPVVANGGASAVQINTQPGCPWSVSEGFSWMSITTAKRGYGNASVGFYVAPNYAHQGRTGWINGFAALYPGSSPCGFGRSSQGGCTAASPAFRLTIGEYGR